LSKKRVGALGASAASAALIGSALFAPAAVAQDDGEHSPSAFGLTASGLIDISKTPYVKDDNEEDFLDIDLGELAGSGTLRAAAHPGKASAAIEDLSLLGVEPPSIPGIPDYSGGLIGVGAVNATCDADGVSSQIANLEIAGQEIPIDVAENTAPIPEPLQGVVDITINEQIENADGSMTVNALEIKLLDGLPELPGLGDLAGQSITLASATCDPNAGNGDGGNGDGGNGDGGNGDGGNGDGGNGDGGNGDGGNGDGGNGDGGNGDGGADEANDDGTAPQPDPQPGHIAVTG